MTPGVHALTKLDEAVARVERLALFLALLGMVGLVFAEVLVRYALVHIGTGATIKGGDEAARLLMVWAGFIGASLAAQSGQHLAVTLKFPLGEKARRAQLFVRFLLTAVFMGFVAVLGWSAFLTKLKYPTLSGALNMNYAYMYLAVPVSFTLMTFRFVLLAVKGLQGKYEDPEPGH